MEWLFFFIKDDLFVPEVYNDDEVHPLHSAKLDVIAADMMLIPISIHIHSLARSHIWPKCEHKCDLWLLCVFCSIQIQIEIDNKPKNDNDDDIHALIFYVASSIFMMTAQIWI